MLMVFQEKYGPKGQGKVSNGGVTPKSNKDSKQRPDVDINVGLSERPPWYCRYVLLVLFILLWRTICWIIR